MSEWIKTEEQLPHPDDIVLCADIYNSFVTLGRYIEDQDCFFLMNIDNVEVDSYPTHWRPLPNLPTED